MKLFSTQFSLLIICVLLSAQIDCFSQGTFTATFDGPPIQPPGSDYAVTNYDEFGMSFKPLAGSFAFGRVFPADASDPQNGTAYLRTALGDSLMFNFSDGSLFNVHSVDLAEYSTAVPDSVTVHFIGYRYDGSTISQDFMTDGIIDGTGPLADFQTFLFGPGWSGLTHVEVPGYGWSLDNLVISIPEPASWLILLAGGLLWFRVRSRDKGHAH